MVDDRFDSKGQEVYDASSQPRGRRLRWPITQELIEAEFPDVTPATDRNKDPRCRRYFQMVARGHS